MYEQNYYGNNYYYHPGTIKAVDYDGTFALDYLYTKYDGSGEKKKRKAGLYPKDLRV